MCVFDYPSLRENSESQGYQIPFANPFTSNNNDELIPNDRQLKKVVGYKGQNFVTKTIKARKIVQGNQFVNRDSISFGSLLSLPI